MPLNAIKPGTAENDEAKLDKVEDGEKNIELDHSKDVTELGVFNSKDLTDTENLDVKTATISITHRIQLREIVPSPIKKRLPKDKELPTEVWRQILDKLKAQGVKHVVLTGGEPTLRSDFHTILQYAINNFKNVTVRTNGFTNRNLVNYDCIVSLPMDYWDDVYNNEVRRMTDPKEYIYHINKGKLIPRQQKKCSFCGRSEFKSESGTKRHITSAHEEKLLEAAREVAEKNGHDISIKDMDDFRGYDQVDFSDFTEPHEEPQNITDVEQAKTRARLRLEQINDQSDNPLVIRTNITNNNDVGDIIAYAQSIGATVNLSPLYPVDSRIEDQVPSPKRYREVMEKVYQVDAVIREDVRIDSPHYKAFEFQASLDRQVKPETGKDEYLNWLRRGRVSDIGVSHIHIDPVGNVMPSRNLRNQEWVYGNIIDDTFQSIYEGMAEFNEEISIPELDNRQMMPEENGYPDPRRRSIAGDLNVYLNKPYIQEHKGGEK